MTNGAPLSIVPALRRTFGDLLALGGRKISGLGFAMSHAGALSARSAGVDPRISIRLQNACRYHGFRIRTVLDVGAHHGQFARLSRFTFPGAEIHSFEPYAPSYARLVVVARGLGDVHAHNFGFAARDGRYAFHANEFSAASSLYVPSAAQTTAFPETARTRETVIECRRLDSWADEHALSDDVLLKLDVQGAEIDVLQGAGDLLGRIRMIVAELSLEEMYVDAPLFSDVVGELARCGFELEDIIGQLRGRDDQRLFQVDGLFVRRSRPRQRVAR